LPEPEFPRITARDCRVTLYLRADDDVVRLADMTKGSLEVVDDVGF
jgi:hypothetical protein